MNQVELIGRLTRDPDVRYTAQSQTAVARFSLAIDRGKNSKGEDQGADFPSIVCFGKTAELVDKYLGKGRLVGITGRLQTGSYEKEGRKIYTTDVVAERVEFLDKAPSGDQAQSSGSAAPAAAGSTAPSDIPEGFSQLTDDDIPF
jgi:single-strand DNA-binding protein